MPTISAGAAVTRTVEFVVQLRPAPPWPQEWGDFVSRRADTNVDAEGATREEFARMRAIAPLAAMRVIRRETVVTVTETEVGA